MIFDRMNYLYIYEFCSKKNKNLTWIKYVYSKIPPPKQNKYN